MKAIPASRYAVFFSIALSGCLLDLGTKSWIFHWRGGPRERPVCWLWEDVVGFETTLNEGALFGMGQRMVALFVGLSIVAAVGVLFWLFFAGAARDFFLTVALALVTAGILGNLYDRLGLPGLRWKHPWIVDNLHQVGEPVYAVRDWILVMIGDRRWPNFNLADSFLVCGAILLGWHALRRDGGEQPDAKARTRPARQR